MECLKIELEGKYLEMRDALEKPVNRGRGDFAAPDGWFLRPVVQDDICVLEVGIRQNYTRVRLASVHNFKNR